MALEDKFDELIAALNANTKALGGAAGKPATGKPAASKVTLDMIKAVMAKVQKKFDRPTAVTLIKKHGKAPDTASVKASFYQALYDAAVAKLEEEVEEEEVAEEDDEV